MKQRVSLHKQWRLRLELGQRTQVLRAPRVEAVLASPERQLPSIDRVLEPFAHRLFGWKRRRCQDNGHLVERPHNEGEIVLGPGLMRVPRVDVLEAQRDPALLVAAPQKCRHWRVPGHRRDNTRLTPVDARRIWIRRLVHGLEEETASVLDAQPRRQPGRKAGWLSDRFDDPTAQPLLECRPDLGREVFPVDADASRRNRVRERRLSAA